VPRASKLSPKKDGDWSGPFLAYLRDTANVRGSAKAAGVTRQTAYARREKDPEFAAGWADAIEDAIEDLERVAQERARSVSDTLLIFLLKAHRPERYRESVRLTGGGKDGALVIELAGDATMSDLMPRGAP
jgi:hypothetical protein